MKKKILILCSIMLLLMITSCKFFKGETMEAFEAVDEQISQSNLEQSEEIKKVMQRLTDSAMTNPEVYASAFNHMNEFHNKSAMLLDEMQHVRDLIDDHVGETGDYEKWSMNTDAIFFTNNGYSENGEQFIQAISDYNLTSSDQLFFFPEAEKIAQSKLNIKTQKNRAGEDVEWLEYHFKGYPAIASKTKIAQLENDVKKIEYTFLKALMEKPQF